MDTKEIIKALKAIQDDARNSAGCSHEDALKGGLIDVIADLGKLIKKLKV